MLLGVLCKGAGLLCPKEYSHINIDGVSVSTDRLHPGDLFVCIDGLHTDSHNFARTAKDKGAAAIVAMDGREMDVPDDMPIIRVPNCRKAMSALYASFYGNVQNCMRFVGVTGTNGKTTVCRILYDVMTRAGLKCGLIGTVGCLSPSGSIDIRSSNGLANMTTPDPEELYKILSVMQRDGVEYVIMEVTSHALALSKVSPIHFEYAVFTNLSEDHFDFHKDMEDYFEAKKKLFYMCDKAVINCDDLYGRKLCKELREKNICDTIRVSACGNAADYQAGDIKYKGIHGVEYKLYATGTRLRVRCSIPGNFTVMNTLEAAVCARLIGISEKEIGDFISTICHVDGRLESVDLGADASFSVFIDYAHTPDALENLLKSARAFKNKNQKIILLFGCGGDRDRYKRKLMGQIASKYSDAVILTSDNSRTENACDIISDIMQGINKESNYKIIENRRQAIEYAINSACKGDIILLAGKGHENYEIDKDGKHPFCEKDIVKSAYEKRCRKETDDYKGNL